MSIRYVGPTLIEINPETVFDSNGAATKWAQARRAGLVTKAKRRAPHGGESGRTNKTSYNPEPFGSLRKGIKGSTSRTGPLQFQITLESTVRYSIYVIKGTKTPITPIARRQPAAATAATGKKIGGQFTIGRRRLLLPANLGYKKMSVKKVRGQAANDFLSDAVEAEAKAHPALLGYDRG